LSVIQFIGLIKLVMLIRFVGQNGLVGFIRLGLVSFFGFGLIELVKLIGLVDPSGIISLIGHNGLIGFIGLGLVGFIGLGLVSLVGLIGHSSLVGPTSFNGISGLIGQISLVDSSASLNHWLINLIGVIGFGPSARLPRQPQRPCWLVRESASTASSAYCLIGCFAIISPQL
jgi:hypothetical protein